MATFASLMFIMLSLVAISTAKRFDETQVSDNEAVKNDHEAAASVSLLKNDEKSEQDSEDATTPDLSTTAENNATDTTDSELSTANQESVPSNEVVLRLPKRVLNHLIRCFGEGTEQSGLDTNKCHYFYRRSRYHERRRLEHTLRKLIRELMNMEPQTMNDNFQIVV